MNQQSPKCKERQNVTGGGQVRVTLPPPVIRFFHNAVDFRSTLFMWKPRDNPIARAVPKPSVAKAADRTPKERPFAGMKTIASG